MNTSSNSAPGTATSPSHPSNTAVLIIHGAYFHATIWAAFRTRLSAANTPSQCPQLPSCGDTSSPSQPHPGQPEDIAVVKDAARSLIAQGKRIVVVAHSYGGIVACGALTPDLLCADVGEESASGTSTGTAAGIAHIVFLAAWVPQPGKTLQDVIAAYGFQSKCEVGFSADGARARVANAAESFFNDVREEEDGGRERAEGLAARTTTHNWAATATAVPEGAGGRPYARVASTFVVTARDAAIERGLQEAMVRDMVEAGAGVRVRVVYCGHCAFLSREDEFLDIVKEVL